MIIKRRQGDQLPPITARAFNGKQFVDLTVFTSITFRAVSGSIVITGNATYDANGNLAYHFGLTDLAIPGTYQACFIAVDALGKEQTFPTGENITLIVTPDI